MIADANICGVNIIQENQVPKLIMAHGIHLDLFKNIFVNNVRIDKHHEMALLENAPKIFVRFDHGDIPYPVFIANFNLSLIYF